VGMGANWFGMEWGFPFTRYAGVSVRTYRRRCEYYHTYLNVEGEND